MSDWPPDPTTPAGPPPVGGPVPGWGAPTPPPDPTMMGGGYGDAYSDGYAPPPPDPRSGPNTGLIVGLVLLVAAVIGGGVLLLTQGGDDDESENASNRRDRQGQEDCAPEPGSPNQLRGQEDPSSPLGGGAETPPELCIDPEDIEVPEVTVTVPEDLEVPEVPDVEVPEVDTTEVPEVSEVPSGDVVITLAESIYEVTPPSIDEETSICIAEVIVGVVGESEVSAAGGDYYAVYQGTTSDQDAAISSGIYSSCTSIQQDSDLAGDTDWPGPWAPA
jgi:hypothetical protein